MGSRNRTRGRWATGVPLGRAWVVVLVLLAAVLGRTAVQAGHDHHAGEARRCPGACVETGEGRAAQPDPERRERDRPGCELCEKYTLAKLGMAGGLTTPLLPGVRMVEVEGSWAWVERAESRRAGSVRARGPPVG